MWFRTLLSAKSIAVIGASNDPQHSGYHVLYNIREYGFKGVVYPINPNFKVVQTMACFANLSNLPSSPDIAIICNDHQAQEQQNLNTTLTQLDKMACSLAIITHNPPHDISPNVSPNNSSNVSNEFKVTPKLSANSKSAKGFQNLRILGPCSTGWLAPWQRLNLGFAPNSIKVGNIAVISQSNSISSGLLDWAVNRQIGFSHFINLGQSCDLSLSEVLAHLSQDSKTQTILLCLRSIDNGRKFMSAARTAAFAKPVLVLKTRAMQAQPISYNTIHNVHPDNSNVDPLAFDAAVKRAGMLSFNNLQALLTYAERLAHGKRPSLQAHGQQHNKPLLIISNGWGVAELAMTALNQQHPQYEKSGLADLNSPLTQSLANHPSIRLASNPIILKAATQPKDYISLLKEIHSLQPQATVLLIHSPQYQVNNQVLAQAVADWFVSSKGKANLMVNWLGETSNLACRTIFANANISAFRTPENAVSAFMQMQSYIENQVMLQQTPEAIPTDIQYEPNKAEKILTQAWQQNKTNNALNPLDCSAMLACYGMQSVPCLFADTIINAADKAEALGYPVALKVNNPQSMPYKAQYGGVQLDLQNAMQVINAGEKMMQQLQAHPTKNTTEHGFIVQKMLNRVSSHEIRILVKRDNTLGSVIYLGQGAYEWQLHRDAIAALPPLNSALAHNFINQAFEQGKLRDHHSVYPIDRHSLALFLCQLSQFIIDQPSITTLDINPLVADKSAMLVLDVNIQINEPKLDNQQHAHLAIQPYPSQWQRKIKLPNQQDIIIRPIRAEDEPAHRIFDQHMSNEDRYKRYFGNIPKLDHFALARLTQLDYDQEIAFIATTNTPANPTTLGVVRAQFANDNATNKSMAEFAIVIQQNFQGLGLSKSLMQLLIDYCQSKQIKTLKGVTMLDNHQMAGLAKSMGFTVTRDFDAGEISMVLML
ncbi:hypothetical protein C2869_17385 [Saccharobesus litoralis]|uniref:N-acetyltransferase domain-containing protein n=1 Tax=Saccharobesus litoralis TaxID=2172099 RepID=A0A2S0VV60_9ALTE|nr:GNAT family N-acetyltransferase [Saccharobesus litoralis]AWB68085.1 hypothetical protein C2869_17385 [Saccharobesus litoralis]